MTLWWQSPMAPFDLETTGVNIRVDRVLTGYVGLLLPQDPGIPWEVQTQTQVLADPGVPIHPEATKVHGITTEYAQQHGADPRDVIESIAYALARSMKAGIPAVGYNLAYDLGLLHYECLRYDLPTVTDRLGLRPGQIAPVVDARVLDKYVDPYRRGSRTLTAACEHYGVRLEGAHDSTFDALAAARIAYRIAQRNEEIGNMKLLVLHDKQTIWYRIQTQSLERYFRKTNPNATVDPCWPLCINPTHANT